MRTKLIILFIATILAQQAFTQSLKWNKKANPANNTFSTVLVSNLKNGLYTLFIETNNNLKSHSKFIKN